MIILSEIITSAFGGETIKNYYFKIINKSYFTINFILFSIFFICFTFLGFFDITSMAFDLTDNNLLKFEIKTSAFGGENSEPFGASSTTPAEGGDSSKPPVEEGSSEGSNLPSSNDNTNINSSVNNNFNLNNPKISLTLSKEALNNAVAAGSSAGGAALGLKVAQYVSGSPATKVLAGVGSAKGVQATTAVMSKILNNNSNNNNDNKKKKNRHKRARVDESEKLSEKKVLP